MDTGKKIRTSLQVSCIFPFFLSMFHCSFKWFLNCDCMLFKSKKQRKTLTKSKIFTLGKSWDFRFTIAKQTPPKKNRGALYYCRCNISHVWYTVASVHCDTWALPATLFSASSQHFQDSAPLPSLFPEELCTQSSPWQCDSSPKEIPDR